MTIQWPSFYPLNCPPTDALPAELTVDIYLKNIPPTDNDFNCKCQREKKAPDSYGDFGCQACGLSVYAQLADIKNAQHVIPGMNKKYIAAIELTASCGQIKHTPTTDQPDELGYTHHTWWSPNAFNFQSLKVDKVGERLLEPKK